MFKVALIIYFLVKPFPDTAHLLQYQGEDGWKPQNYTGLCEKLLTKSQNVVCKVYYILSTVALSHEH